MVARNFTLALDEELIRAAKVEAARNGTSVSAMVSDYLRTATGFEGGQRPPANERETLKRYSQGRMPRRRAMALLKTDYDGLLDRLGAAGLPIPRLPEADLKKMMKDVARLTKADA